MKVLKLNAHEKPINQLKINFDGDLLFSASSDRKINLWNSYTGERLGNYDSKGAIFTIDLTDDSKYLISGTLDGAIEVFEINGGKNLGCLRSKRKCKKIEFCYGNAEICVVKKKKKNYKNTHYYYYFPSFSSCSKHFQAEIRKLRFIILKRCWLRCNPALRYRRIKWNLSIPSLLVR